MRGCLLHYQDYYVFFFVFLLLSSGVFDDVKVDVKSVSVMEGDSVTLHINPDETQRALKLLWRFNGESKIIAEIKRESNEISIPGNADGRFRDRLKLDHQSGSLTITNITMIDFGLYQLDIISSSEISQKRFIVTVHELETVSVMEWEPVILRTETQTGDVIEWRFEDTVIAQFNRTSNRFMYISDDERFKDRLQVDQTGSLTITKIKSEDSGLYEVNINNSKHLIHKRFSVTVKGSTVAVMMSVMEGDSVILHINADEIQRAEKLLWTFNCEETSIANIDLEDNKISVPGNDDERFRDRLQVDHSTGSLTISDFRTRDTGLYQLEIISRSEISHRKFGVTVREVTHIYWERTGPVLLATVIVLGVIVILLLSHKVNKRCRKRHSIEVENEENETL